MELSEKDKAIILECMNQAWAGGGVRSPAFAGEVEMLRQRLMAPTIPKPPAEPPKEKEKG